MLGLADIFIPAFLFFKKHYKMGVGKCCFSEKNTHTEFFFSGS